MSRDDHIQFGWCEKCSEEYEDHRPEENEALRQIIREALPVLHKSLWYEGVTNYAEHTAALALLERMRAAAGDGKEHEHAWDFDISNPCTACGRTQGCDHTWPERRDYVCRTCGASRAAGDGKEQA